MATVYFGKIDDMIAEVGAHDMGAAWFRENGFRYAVLPHDDEGTNYGTEYFATKTDARAHAKEWANHLNATVAFI